MRLGHRIPRAIHGVALALIFGLLLPAGPARSDVPDRLGQDGIDFARQASQVWTGVLSLDANTTTATVTVGATGPTAASSTVGVVFGWGTRVRVACDNVATVCWSMSAAPTIGSQAAASAASTTLHDPLQSAGNAAGGACIHFGAGGAGALTMIANRYALEQSFRAGYRTGICATGQSPQTDITPHVPYCHTNRDCTVSGSHTPCSDLLANGNTQALTDLRRLRGGAFLLARALNATTKCTFTIER